MAISHLPIDTLIGQRIDDALLKLAYRNSLANILVNVAAGIILSLILAAYASDPSEIAQWCTLLALLTVARLVGAFRFSRHCANKAMLTPRESARWRGFYALGLFSAVLLWVYMTRLALSLPGSEAQFSALIVVAAMAAGATGILAPQVLIGQVYIALMLIQGALQLAFMPDPQLLLATLAAIFSLVMIVAIRNNHAVLRRSLQFQFENESLMGTLEDERLSLECRVKERTFQLKHEAEHDRLTQLLNREGLNRQLDERRSQLSPSGFLAVIFIDLDRFKQINDGMGHEVGDKVLVGIADRLARAAPSTASLCRWGGDEFVILLEMTHESSKAEVRTVLNALRAAVESPLDVAGTILHVGFSAGVSLQPVSSFSLAAAIRAADLAAAEVKRNGRGSAEFYSDELAETQERKLSVAQALKGAVERGEFRVAFQPLVEAATGQISSYEALARWHCPQLGPVGPDEFIPIAEETGEIAEIGNFVLNSAIAVIGESESLAQNTKIAVNVSLRQLIRPDLLGQVQQALAARSVAPQRLVIEVTESIFESRNVDTIIKTLTALSASGIEIHLDDFGTGYSSLSRLHEMPISGIKIDKSFVRRLDRHAVAIIEGTVLISRRLGITTIAEGVETAEQAAALQLMGIQLFQGYLFGRPSEELSADQPEPIQAPRSAA